MTTKSHGTLLFVAPTAYPLGGVAVWLSYLVPGLQQCGWKVVFGALQGKFHDADRYLKIYPFSETVRINNPVNTRFGRVSALRRTIVDVDADIVLSVNNADVYVAALQVRQKRKPNLKIIMTLHGLQWRFFSQIVELADRLDAVLVTNQLTRKMVNKVTKMPAERVLYAPYGVSIPDQSEQFNHSNPKLRLLHVGRITDAQKCCSQLLEIALKLARRGQDFTLQIAGDGDLLDQLKSRSAQLLPAGCIEFLGVVDQQRLYAEVYPHADVFVLTSEWETGPIVAWEAMAHRVVLVTSDYIGSRSEGALKHEHNCLIYPRGNVDAAVDQLLSLADSKLREQLADNAFRTVCDTYSRSNSIMAWHQQLLAVLQMPMRPGGQKARLPRNRDGRLERLLGNRLADYCRRIFGYPALINDAGDEWPHSYAQQQDFDLENFSQQLQQVENDS